MNASTEFAAQNAEFDAVAELAKQYRRLTMTGIVDDDYPEVRHGYESALTALLDAIAANGHRRLPQATPKSLTLNALRNANIERNMEWDDSGKLPLMFWGLELGGEAGEALNKIKKLERERLGVRGSRATKEELAEELGDVVICASLTAIAADIDLEQATVKKFNKTSRENDLTVLLPE